MGDQRCSLRLSCGDEIKGKGNEKKGPRQLTAAMAEPRAPSTVELVSLPETLTGCPRLCDDVPESSRHFLENMQIMIKKQG